MNNVNFRKALAYALNPTAIAQAVYGGIAAPANPTGLLPTLSAFVDQAVVSAERAHLQPGQGQAAAGEVRLQRRDPHLEAPQGWSDWSTRRRSSSRSSTRSASRSSVIEPSANQRTAELTNGNYDLALDNNAGLDSTPVVLLPARLPAPDRQGADSPS